VHTYYNLNWLIPSIFSFLPYSPSYSDKKILCSFLCRKYINHVHLGEEFLEERFWVVAKEEHQKTEQRFNTGLPLACAPLWPKQFPSKAWEKGLERKVG
jgi:hypothetical protein